MKQLLLVLAFAAALLPAGASHERASADGFSHRDRSASGDVLPARPAGRIIEASVIGADERVQVTQTESFPFSAVAYLELEDSFGVVFASCTATFIGPDALLTAGHCLWDAELEDWGAEHIRVVPGKDGGFEPFGSQYASDWWVPDQYALSGSPDWDWGVIKLPNGLLSDATGWLSVTVAPTEALEDPEFFPTIVGYPGDKPEGTMWGLIRSAFLAVEEFTLYYDIDTAPGQSGSAIWSAADGPYLGLVVGIHSHGASVNSGARIDRELMDDLLTACEAMDCTIDEVEAPGPPEPYQYHSYTVAVARD